MAETRIDERTRRVLEFVIQFKLEHDGNSPTIREIQDGTGISSTSLVSYYLGRLQQDGEIRLDEGRSRGIKVIGGSWQYGGRHG